MCRSTVLAKASWLLRRSNYPSCAKRCNSSNSSDTNVYEPNPKRERTSVVSPVLICILRVARIPSSGLCFTDAMSAKGSMRCGSKDP
jgi:hypothetical protein